MRFVKRVLLSLGLMLFAVVALNALRLASAPAQGNPGGEGQSATRNGDVNCDGLLDITDPILVLNWLFLDGPEPCAIAQADTCCQDLRQEVAALRAEVQALSSHVTGPNDFVCQRGTIRLTRPGTQTLVDVPEGKRFVVTSYTSRFGGKGEGRLVSLTNGTPAEITEGLATKDASLEWSSGFAFPTGSDVGARVDSVPNPPEIDYFINGYFIAE